MPHKTNNKIQRTVSPTTNNVPINPTYEKPSLGSTILQGFALGTGQSLAFNMFRTEPVKEVKEVKETNPKIFVQCIQDTECNKLLESFLNVEFIQCMKDNNYEDCKQYIHYKNV